MSDSPELLDLAVRLAGQARDGEQVEAYVARGTSTSVKAYRGEVESLTSAESFGVGIRVVRDRRQGFAHCGTFDAAVVAPHMIHPFVEERIASEAVIRDALEALEK